LFDHPLNNTRNSTGTRRITRYRPRQLQHGTALAFQLSNQIYCYSNYN